MDDRDSTPRPTSRYRPRKRHHRCFELCVKFQTDDASWLVNHGEVLVHGIPIGHAWMERDGWVFDPVEDISESCADYERRRGAVRHATFTYVEVSEAIDRTGHYGPWVAGLLVGGHPPRVGRRARL